MTVQEFYEWAKENDVVNCDISVRDIDGDYTSNIQPEKVLHTYSDGSKYFEVEL